jgi:hypothetical protein
LRGEGHKGQGSLRAHFLRGEGAKLERRAHHRGKGGTQALERGALVVEKGAQARKGGKGKQGKGAQGKARGASQGQKGGTSKV